MSARGIFPSATASRSGEAKVERETSDESRNDPRMPLWEANEAARELFEEQLHRIGSDEATHSTPTVATIHGKEQVIFLVKRGLVSLDPANGKVEPFLDRPRRERFKGLNDLVFAKNGDLYFTDQGEADLRDPTGRLFRLRAPRDGQGGTLDLLLDNVPSPNGLVLTPNEDILYLAVTRGNAVWRVSA